MSEKNKELEQLIEEMRFTVRMLEEFTSQWKFLVQKAAAGEAQILIKNDNATFTISRLGAPMSVGTIDMMMKAAMGENPYLHKK